MFKFIFLPLVCFSQFALQAQSLGIFEDQSDVGAVLHPGSAEFDPATKTYTIAGSGENMWFAKDEFRFVWRKISAEDLALTADIAILGAGGDGHRKGVLMIRQSLDTDSAYVDAARHGEGLTSLQFRETKGAITHEIESNVSGPASLRIEKRGNRFYMWIAAEGDRLEFAGGSAWVELRAPFYVGIGVCAHNKDATEKVAFTNVELDTAPRHAKGSGKYSTIETVLLSGDARAGYVSPKRITSPGWSPDGHALTYNSDREHEQTTFTPLRTAAPVGPPVPARVGSDFSYFETRTGNSTQIWRKSADASQSVQFTPDELNNTSPHVSPDGKYLLFLSYSKEYSRLAENTPLQLRLMLLTDNTIKTLATFIGGPESLGPQPWSPDAKRIVFVTYESGVGTR